MYEKVKYFVKFEEGMDLRPPHAKKETVKLLLSEETGARNFCMIVAESQPGGGATLMTHDVEQAIYVISGKMEFIIGDRKYVIGPDTAIYIPPNTPHGYTNIGVDKVKFVSIYAPQGPEKKYRK